MGILSWNKNKKNEYLLEDLDNSSIKTRKTTVYSKGSIKVSNQEVLRRLRFHGITEEDLGVIAHWKGAYKGVADQLIDEFYDHVLSQPETNEILNKYSSVERQRPRLTAYILTLFSGIIDDKYIEFRRHVGHLHDKIDLDSNWYVAMYEVIRRVIMKAIMEAGATTEEAFRFREALNRIIQVDIALVTTALTDSRLNKINELKKQQTDTMQNLVQEIIRAAKEGNLNKRVDPDLYEGEVKDFVEAINEMLDSIIKPISEASKILKALASQDLSQRITGDYQGDHAIIKDAVNDALYKLNDTLNYILISVNEVNAGAEQLSDQSINLSQGATEQASSLEEISSTMEEITAQTRHNTENALQANTLSNEALQQADSGNQRMNSMLSAMDEINKASGQISKIIKVIDEIAFQTNLLALNAAVEAARAGVHGKGFAVVADEVRNLASRSANAAKETTELIEGSVKKVQNGSLLAHETAASLSEIVEAVTRVTDLVGEIASASREQSTGISQVNDALTQLDNITQGNASSAEQSASASEQLNNQVFKLREILNKFRLSKQGNYPVVRGRKS